MLAALETGRGFAIIDGVPMERVSRVEAQAIYWVIGQLLGAPIAQNVQGTLLYDVRDTGQDVAYGARFSVTSAESSFHTDNSFGETVLDYVGLLCLSTAKSGGLSQNVSGYAALDELSRSDPERTRDPGASVPRRSPGRRRSRASRPPCGSRSSPETAPSC